MKLWLTFEKIQKKIHSKKAGKPKKKKRKLGFYMKNLIQKSWHWF